MANVKLIFFGPGSVAYKEGNKEENFAAGVSHAGYELTGFQGDADIHAFIRLVPLLGEALHGSSIPLDKVDKIGGIMKAVIRAMGDGKVTPGEIAAVVAALTV